jgi:hypothetical protein
MSDAVSTPTETARTVPQSAGENLSIPWLQGYPLLARIVEWVLRPPVLLLLMAALLISHGITKGEVHFYFDETHHAFTGVFFRDLLVDHPFAHPLQYAYEYYAKYPAVTVPHWPPLFHAVEGVFYLVLGISVWVSRLTVLAFSLLGVYFWYRIAEGLGSRYRAFLSALIYAFLPYVLLYERVTMLEVPVVSLCLGAIYFWLRYREEGRTRDLWLLTFFVIAGGLTSQAAIFLVFFIPADLLLHCRFRLLGRWQVWLALAVAMAIVLPWYWLTFRTLTFALQRAVGTSFEYLAVAGHWTYYLNSFPEQLGWILLSLSVIGAIYALIIDARRYRSFLIWPLVCYVCFTLILEKDRRHTMIWIPVLVYFALLGVEALLRRRRWAWIGTTAVGVIVLVSALRFERPWVAGVEDVARFVLSQPDSDIVYYQGGLNGDFVFFVRKFDPQRSHMVAREKQVAVTKVGYEQRPVLQSPDGFRNFVRDWGIRYAVIESEDFIPGLEAVREALGTDQFELVRTFPVRSNDPKYARLTISVYRYRGELHRSAERAVIPMLTIRDDIRVDLNRIVGKPWPN